MTAELKASRETSPRGDSGVWGEGGRSAPQASGSGKGLDFIPPAVGAMGRAWAMASSGLAGRAQGSP